MDARHLVVPFLVVANGLVLRGAFLLDEDRRAAFEKMSKIKEIRKKLPGIDCGSCGAPNCSAFAEDIVQGKAEFSGCVFRKGKQL